MLKFITNKDIINIPTYELDNIETISDRLAAELNTLGKYLYFPNGSLSFEIIKNNEIIEVEDLLHIIFDFTKNKDADFSKLYEKIKNKTINFKIAIELFLKKNKDFEYASKMKDDTIMFFIYKKLKDQILKIVIDQILADEIYDNYLKKLKNLKDLKDIIENLNLKTTKEILKKIEYEDKINNKIFRILDLNIEEMSKVKSNVIDKEIEKNKKTVKAQIKILKNFDTIKSVQYTDFELNKIKFTIKLNVKDISLMEIFNNIKLTSYVPFATTNNFFKILKSFKPSTDWSYVLSKSIFLKVLQSENDYTDVILYLDEDDRINIQLNLLSGKITKDELIKRVLDIFGFDSTNIENQEVNEVNGVFYIPKFHFNNYIFYDLAMNNTIFSNILSIDESVYTTKKRSNIYIHFDHEKTGKITSDITEKILDSNDIYMKNKKDENNLFSVNDNYIRIKIRKSKNIESVKYFQNIISKLFTIYNQEYNSINAIYSEFIPNFLCNDMIPKTVINKDNIICLKEDWEKRGLKKKDLPELKEWKGKTYQMYLEYVNKTLKPSKKDSQKKVKLKDVAPEIFASSFSRGCGTKRHPQILNEDEVNDEVMIFPKKSTEGYQRRYYCPDDKFKYPGLIENNLGKNKDKFPYVPCCFSKNQNIEGSGSKRRYYYEGEELKQSEKLQQDIWKTNKFLPNDVTGVLPIDINKIFEITNINNSYYQFYRKGVFRNKNSFLNCVLESINVENVAKNMIRGTKNFNIGDEVEARFCKTSIWLKAHIISEQKSDGAYEVQYVDGFRFIQDEIEREEALNDIRKTLATESLASCCKQEMYDVSIAEIIEIILNTEKYFDPKLFLHLLEVKYNVNIFLFDRENIKGNFVTPRHIQAYYKMKNTSNYVFIFEHIGSESDNSTYPQCELIFQWDEKNEESTYNFPEESSVAKNVKYIFNKLNNVYTLNMNIVNIEYEFNLKDVKIESQIIDFYGKTRMLNLNYKNNIISIFTTPIQPFMAPLTEYDLGNFYKSKITLVRDLIKYLDINIINQITEGKILKEIYCKLGDIYINIPVTDTNVIENIPILNKPTILNFENKSYIVEYNKYKKLSRYIFEYLLWLYSKYMNKKNLKVNDFDKNIDKFIDLFISIDPNFEYSYVSKFFSMKSGVMNNNKLVVKSEETLKRLLYVLRLLNMRNEKKVSEYYTKTMIQYYYVDILDFDYYSTQIILHGKDSISKWNKNNDNEYFHIFNSIFIENENIEKKILKKKNEDDVEENEEDENGSIFSKFEQKNPYFFKNNLISDKVYLAQNTDSIYKAIKIAMTWNNEKYNPGYDVVVEPDFDISSVNFILYSYINSKNIVKYNINNSENFIQIIGYKSEDNKNLFTVLL